MTLILAATILLGVIVTKLLLTMHVNRMWIRYALAVIVAYAGFLGLIKGWLLYLGICARRDRSAGALDLVDIGDFGNAFCGFGSRSVDLALESGGGKFGGGGASGSWGDSEPMAVVPVNASGSGGGGSGWLDFDFDEGIVLVLLIAVVLAILSAGIYLVWAAPAIFGEAAFNAALATALVKKTKNMHEPGWVGSVMKSTVIPFTIVLALTIALGVMAQKRCPSATRLRDVFGCVHR